MRKMLLAVTALMLMTGLAAAVEVTLIRFDKESKEVIVREGDAEAIYKITDATKFVGVDKEGNTRDMTYDDALKGLGSPKAEGALKFDITVKENEIALAKMPAKKLK